MALNSRVLLSALFHIIFARSFLEISNGFGTDVDCLKSIKDSLGNPNGYLKDSRNFNDNTEGFICSFTGVECWHPSGEDFPRGIKNCTSLTGLDLSDNELSGPLPFDIAELVPSLSSLNLSGNKFSGEIPKNTVNCSYLNVLILDHNQLTGEIPPELGLLGRIKIFSISENMLSGVVPDFGSASNLQADSFANNKGLCGRPLKPCKTPKRGLKFDFSLKGGFVVGYVVWFALMTRKAIRRRLSKERTSKNEEKEADQVNQSQTLGLLQEATKKNSQLEGMVTKMNFMELSEATNNFSTDNTIGLGKMGVMYKAVLPNGSPLAVKRLLGCQSFEKTSYVNYWHWLHAKEGNDKIFEWPLRIKIVIGIARGLAWLHHKWDFKVVHLKLSSNSILLDKNFVPNISNFGGAKISSSEGMMFIDSNNSNSSNSSFVDSGVWELGFVKKDVYDFGILLIELIIGKEPIQINNFSNSLNGSLANWITHLLSSSSDLYSVIDKSLIGR
ncbi:putativeinactive leucine-rich repeat receptor-like protein kinase [Quercus suber]|uniref:Putativeinactive leucine-rich repeat receptor-like protein kinase n=1 Tax=Quercus suber TaxID=58331 RepID=A0AAW0KTM5_QUESU